MRKSVLLLVLTAMLFSLAVPAVYADSKKTWANVGKGLAIYEGVKVLTGREGNIVDDVTGGMKPRKGSSEEAPSSSGASTSGDYESGYNAGYKSGYEAGYNAGFRQGVEHDTSK